MSTECGGRHSAYLKNLREAIKNEKACVRKYAAKMQLHQETVKRLEARLHEQENWEEIQHAAQAEAARAKLLVSDTPAQQTRPRCQPPCNKLRYGGERAALLANHTNGHRMRAYYSTECGCWHVTKGTKKK